MSFDISRSSLINSIAMDSRFAIDLPDALPLQAICGS
jgi:hypothetical protein